MKKLSKYIFYTVLAAIALSGCKQDIEQPDLFAISENMIEADPDEGIKTIIISAPGAWSIESIPEWCTVTPEEWHGSREITVNYTENTGTLREASLSVVCGTDRIPLSIRQKGKNLAVPPTNVSLYAKSTSSLTFTWDDVSADRTYTVQCASEPSDKAIRQATYSYTWTTKSNNAQWPYDFPTRFTFLGLTEGESKAIGKAENLLTPGTSYYFRVRCGGADQEAIWSEWLEATTEIRTPAENEIFHEDFDRACVGGGDWLHQAAGARIKNDNTVTSIWGLQWNTVNEASKTYGNYYTSANFNEEVYKWIGYTRIWDRGDGKGDIQPCPGYTKCGNGSNPGVFRILALGSEKLSAEGNAVQLSFKATPWAEVTASSGYTVDNKHVDIYVNDTKVAGPIAITDSEALNGNPAVLTDMILKTVTVAIPNLKPNDTITIRSNGSGKGRFFIDEISIIRE